MAMNPRFSQAAMKAAAASERPQAASKEAVTVGAPFGDNNSKLQIEVDGQRVFAEATIDAPIVSGDKVYAMRAASGKWVVHGTA
jgi:hypothetical protein